MRFRKMKLLSPVGGTQQVGVPEKAAKSVTPCFHLRLVATSNYIQVLYFRNVISQAGQNCCRRSVYAFQKKDISSMTTYFA